MTDWTTDLVDVEVSTVRPAVLVLADAWYPGWTVAEDGVPAPLVRANYAFRAVPVPEGRHTVEFAYRPWWWPSLGYLMAASWLLAGGLTVWGLVRGRTFIQSVRA